MYEPSSKKRKSHKRSRRRKKTRQSVFHRFIQSWSKLSNELALEYFGRDLRKENEKLLVGVIACLFISFIAFFSMVQRPVQAMNWQVTQGKIVEKVVERRSSGKGSSARLNVKYSYTSDGKRYVGTQIDFALMRGSAYSWIPIVGKNISVYFDPNDPENSVLDRSPPWILLFLSFCVLTISLFFAVGALITAIDLGT